MSWSVEVRRAPDPGRLAADVREGLAKTPVEIPPKWFYDEKGSQLFDKLPDAQLLKLPTLAPPRSPLPTIAPAATTTVSSGPGGVF